MNLRVKSQRFAAFSVFAMMLVFSSSAIAKDVAKFKDGSYVKINIPKDWKSKSPELVTRTRRDVDGNITRDKVYAPSEELIILDFGESDNASIIVTAHRPKPHSDNSFVNSALCSKSFIEKEWTNYQSKIHKFLGPKEEEIEVCEAVPGNYINSKSSQTQFAKLTVREAKAPVRPIQFDTRLILREAKHPVQDFNIYHFVSISGTTRDLAYKENIISALKEILESAEFHYKEQNSQ